MRIRPYYLVSLKYCWGVTEEKKIYAGSRHKALRKAERFNGIYGDKWIEAHVSRRQWPHI